MKYPAYPKYKASGVEWLCDVPEHWEVKKGRWMGRLIGSVTPAETDFSDEEGLPFAKVDDLNYLNSGFRLTETKAKVVGLPAGINQPFLLFPKRGAAIFTNKVAIAEGGFLFDSNLMGWVISRSNNIKFVAYCLTARRLDDLADVSTVPQINNKHIYPAFFPVPPLHEQRAIADFLDAQTAKLDTLLAKKRALIETLREQRTALISQTVTRGLPADAARAAGFDPQPKLKPSGIEWLGDVPEHWEVKTVTRVAAAIQTGPFGSQLHQRDYVEGGTPLINPAHIVSGEIQADDSSTVDEATVSRLSRHRLQEGDIIFARRGEIGRCAVVNASQRGWLCGTGSLVVRLAQGVPSYFARLFRSTGFSQRLELNAVGTTMLNINPSIVGRMLLPVPPLIEQHAIAAYLDRETARLDRMMEKVAAAIERLQEYRTALITAAVTGRIDVRNVVASEETNQVFSESV